YILDRIKAAYDLNKRITEDDLVVYVKDYLNNNAPKHEFHQPDGEKLRFNISLPKSTAAALSDYIEEKKLHGKTRLAADERVQCEFINKTNISTNATVEQINQFHPLIRFISTEVGTEVLHPLVAVRIHHANDIEESLQHGQYAFAIQKWTFTGLNNEEDMQVRMVHIESNCKLNAEDSWKLLNVARLKGADWPEAEKEMHLGLSDKIFDCYADLNLECEAIYKTKSTENEDRVKFQINSAERHCSRQVESLNAVLENHISRNETRMIPATKGRIDRVQRRFDVQIEKLKRRSEMGRRNQDVCCGVLFIE
ncbi:MAG: hypothetical protein ACR2P7_04965, partial [bacterium]